MPEDMFWSDLRTEILSRSITSHPLYVDLINGKLKRATIAELCGQFKYTVTDGIACLALIIPQVPRELKKELAENLFGELTGTPEVPSHWELALRAGAAAGYTEAEIDAKPMFPETKLYPDTVSAYAMRGAWLEALSFVALGIEDMFTIFCDGAAKALKQHYGWDDDQVEYFAVHVGADTEHAETGWNTATRYATTEERKKSVRRAALEGRTMWWNMHSAVYRLCEEDHAPMLRAEV